MPTIFGALGQLRMKNMGSGTHDPATRVAAPSASTA